MDERSSIVVRSRRVVLPDGERAAAVHIEGGVIRRVSSRVDAVMPRGVELVDVGSLVVSPGLVDTHVHVNEPGRTDWEGFETATRAAAAGGVTTIVDMPLNSVPATTTVDALQEKRWAAAGKTRVDVAFWGGVVPGNLGHLDGLTDGGVRGFKCFLVPSGVDEFREVTEADLRLALPVLRRRRLPLLVHAEDPNAIARATQSAWASTDDGGIASDRSDYRRYLSSRPPGAEVQAIGLAVRLAAEFGVHVHIVHVSSVDGADQIAHARAAGVAVTAETCPHYLTFAAEDVPMGATEFKCAPPIRERGHRAGLWEALRRGALQMVVTDHSPAPPAMKTPSDFLGAWGGIASLELSLAATWTAARARGFDVTDLARWMSEAPAELAGLSGRKGAITVGFDADLVIWDPDASTIVDPLRLEQRHKVTPYAGRRLDGRVHMTLLRGRRVWEDGRPTSSSPGGLLF